MNVGQLQAVEATANKGWKLTTNKTGTGTAAGSSVEQISPDETVTIVAGDNIAVEQAGGKVTVATNKDVAFSTVQVGSVAINGTTNKITGIQAGDLSASSTDAVNGSQLYATNQNVATNSNNITNLQNRDL